MIEDVLPFWLVRVSVWISMACWFTGTGLLLHDRQSYLCKAWTCQPRQSAGIIWLSGCVLMTVHILASYALEHQWSHQAALRFTGDQSEAVTSFRAEWGLYVNFAFLIVWLLMAGQLMASQLIAGRSPPRWLELLAHDFLASMVFFATIVFEDGGVRFASLAGFLILASLCFTRDRSLRIRPK